jgi:putative phosphoesterase
LISDTHGLLRPQALAALRGSNCIVHAGDIGDPSILERLSAIGPVTAVRGNNDHGTWASRLPDSARLDIGGVRLFVIHDLAQLDLDPATAGIDVIVSGHSHRPRAERRNGVLYVNPGSAGPRRFKLPVSIATLSVGDRDVDAEILALELEPVAATSEAHRGRHP